MSLDRYLTLRYPLKYGRNKRQSLVAYKIITIWLISFAICLPLFILGLVNSSNVYNETTRACFPAHRTFKIYGSFVAFFIPLIIMIVTYALTMSALQQAHTTKQNRYKRREKIHAVINLAAMAIRWKRAVNTIEIPDEEKKTKKRKLSISPEQCSAPLDQSVSDAKTCETRWKRTSSLRAPLSTAKGCVTEGSRPLVLINWHEYREKPVHPLAIDPSNVRHEKRIAQSLIPNPSFLGLIV